jgi:hypothetical protein
MRLGKVGLIALMISLILVCFGLSAAHAQAVPDLTNWENTWFSITAKASGWQIEGEPPVISTSSGSDKGYLNIWKFVGDEAYLEVDLWLTDLSGNWERFATAHCDYVGGATDQDFICNLNGVIQPDQQPKIYATFGTFIRITGKPNTKTPPPIWKSATLKSSGGFVEGNLDEDYPNTLTVGGITLTGTWLNVTTFCKGNNLSTPPCTQPTPP